MDAKEAIEVIKNNWPSDTFTELINALVQARIALGIQVPKEPIKSVNWYICQSCRLTVKKYENYCPYCGQKIDWSSDKE